MQSSHQEKGLKNPTQELRLRPHKPTFSRVREKVARRAG